MIKIDGMEESLKILREIGEVYDEEILKEANDIGLDFRDDVRANTPPVRSNTPAGTGDLRRGTNFDGTEKTGTSFNIEVYNNIEYVNHVEYGHRQEVGRYVPAIGKRLKKPFVKGYYMFRNAENNIKAELDSRVEKAVRRADDRLND